MNTDRCVISSFWRSEYEVDSFLADTVVEDYLPGGTINRFYFGSEDIGLVALAEISSNEIHPNVSKAYIRVRKSYRRKGVATFFLKYLLDCCSTNYMDVILNEPNSAGISFLENFGFKVVQYVYEFDVHLSSLPDLIGNHRYESKPLPPQKELAEFVISSYKSKHFWMEGTDLEEINVLEMVSGAYVDKCFALYVEERLVCVCLLYLDDGLEGVIFDVENELFDKGEIILEALSNIKKNLNTGFFNVLKFEVDSSNIALTRALSGIDKCTRSYSRHRVSVDVSPNSIP